MEIAMKQEEIQQVQQNLLRWYRKEHRDLPWRRQVSAYRTWVSEIMLQQTRVEAVIPYYERFLAVLPTLRDLALVDDDLLHKLWEGLGYYNRVRNMKKCAQACVEQYDGELPKTYAQLCTLPGIGPYTAGAIASIAYQERVCAVDGNVLRVFSRILANEEDVSKEITKKHYRDYVSAFLPNAEDAGDFNQAIMELGALICMPNKTPDCERCPLSLQCKAHRRGVEDQFPKKGEKKARRVEEYTVLVFVYKNRIALVQRPSKGLLANLYGFPMKEGKLDQKQIVEMYPQSQQIIALHPHVHIFSHVEWHMHAFLIETMDTDHHYHSIEEIEDNYAIPTAYRTFYDAACTWIKMKEGK
ncbi:A/G-specific adenine glycosylase [Merdibacter massiliensis]|uniref:A/G-specific adenine glycosylase n=1 Tax=Merdibacter massiliensis TaxID=1871030 RepID=UPI00096A2B48|nr:A/G-specific adenine glycosylase [Merdibacter massiliensis]